MHYILKGREVVAVPDLITWARSFEKKPNKISKSKFRKRRVHYHVSTVFLGLDHGWGEGEPVVFETMIFTNNKQYDQYQARYTSYIEAQMGHEHAVLMVKKGEKNGK